MNRDRHGLRKTIGHYAFPYSPHVVVICAVWSALAPDTVLANALGFVWLATLFVLLVCGVRYHHGKMCALCAQAMPLDGPAMAERYAGRLRLAHRIMSRRLLAAITIGLLGVNVFIHMTLDPGRPIGIFTFTAPLAYLSWLFYRHYQLQLWCPQCRDNRGDNDVVIQVPDPSPVSR